MTDGLPTDSLNLDELDGFSETTDEKDRKEATGLITTAAIRVRGHATQLLTPETTEEAIRLLKQPPEQGEYVHMVVCKDFSSFDLLPALFRLTKQPAITELYLTTLGISKKNLVTLRNMIMKQQLPAAQTRVLISKFFARACPEDYEMWATDAKKYGFGLRHTRNHAKLILAHIGDNHYVVEGSANMRGCLAIEQYCISNSRQLYDFHKKWIDEVWQKAQE